jgi:hypothetical protein
MELLTECRKQSLALGAFYFGLQDGRQCWWGDSKANLNAAGGILPDSQCNYYCMFDENGPFCGGSWINSVYLTTSDSVSSPDDLIITEGTNKSSGAIQDPLLNAEESLTNTAKSPSTVHSTTTQATTTFISTTAENSDLKATIEPKEVFYIFPFDLLIF